MKQMIPRILLLTITVALLSLESGAQSPPVGTVPEFHSVDELIGFAGDHSITLRNNDVQLSQAKKEKLAAVLGTIDITGSLLSAQFTDNTTLGVNLFPAEIFGGEPGTFREVQMGVRYNTNLTTYADIKLVNPVGWANLGLSKINIDLTASNNQLTRKQLEENITMNYFNIVHLDEQIKNTQLNLNASDTLLTIAIEKYQEGLINRQEVNDVRVNHLQIEERIHQMEFLREQYYVSLKLLCDLPEESQISIAHQPTAGFGPDTVVQLNQLALKNALLQEQYAEKSYQVAKAAFSPTVSLQLSNSNNLYNQNFEPVTGDWINSNFIGLRVNIPIPGSQTISRKYTAQHQYELAQNKTETGAKPDPARPGSPQDRISASSIANGFRQRNRSPAAGNLPKEQKSLPGRIIGP
jgi:outer membrane protein